MVTGALAVLLVLTGVWAYWSQPRGAAGGLLYVALGGTDIRAYDRAMLEAQTDQLAAALPPWTYAADAPCFLHGRWQRDAAEAAEAADHLRTSAAERGLRPVPLHDAWRAQGWRAMLAQYGADWFRPNDRGDRVRADAFWSRSSAADEGLS